MTDPRLRRRKPGLDRPRPENAGGLPRTTKRVKGRRTLNVGRVTTDNKDEEEARATGYRSDSANEGAADKPTRDEPKKKGINGPTFAEAFKNKC